VLYQAEPRPDLEGFRRFDVLIARQPPAEGFLTILH
jgi:hypothetical protein